MVETSRKRRRAEAAIRSSSELELEAHAPLLDAIAATPDDPAPWAVYADLLQTSGHPRGELISLMLERERQPSARLHEAQRRLLALHAPALLPATLDAQVAVAWRRGFVSELRLDAPEQLAEVQRDRSLRFVEQATLAIDLESWAAWRAALTAVRMPWRRLRIELTGARGPLEVAPVVGCAPAVETLRIAFAGSDGGELRWDDVSAPELQLLALENAGNVGSLDAAELPRLEELRLLGTSVPSDALRRCLRWNRLKRVVLVEDDVASELGPVVHTFGRVAHDGETESFVVVGRSIDPALLRKLAGRLSIEHLGARLAIVRQQLTVLQLFGTVDSDVLPYGLAVALGNVIEPAPPIALFEIDDDRAARYLVLGKVPVRGTHDRAGVVVQRALDLALGCDPGSAILHELREALAAASIEPLLGSGGWSQLTMVDPSTARLFVPDDDSDDDPEEDDDPDEDEDDYDPYEYYGDDLAVQFEEPELEAEEPVVPIAIADADMAVGAEPVTDEPPTRPEDEDALELPPEQTEQWSEFHDHWDDRAIDADDESGETRWPDPERVTELAVEVDRQVALPSCARHRRALDDCQRCGTPHCVECGGEDVCSACFAAQATGTHRPSG